MRRSAQRRKRLSGKARKRSIYFIVKLLVIPVVIVLIFIFLKVTTHYWNDHDKFIFTFMKGNGDVGIMVLDPELSEATTLIIPGDTEVDVAENYGTLRIRNVWKLSQNEKLRGKLLPETITQNFLFPVFLWSERDMGNMWKFVLSPGESNIPFGDRVMSAFFLLRVPGFGKTEIDLGQAQFLRKVKLNDGSSGYRFSGMPSERLAVYFSDNDISKESLKINIVDATASPGVAEKVGQILEALGGKVVSVDKKALGDNSDFDSSGCRVLGSDKNIVKKISRLFSCSLGKGESDFDLEIWLNSDFAKRF